MNLHANKYFIRLNKWYNNYKATINTNYNRCEIDCFKYKTKTIIKMIKETEAYKQMKDYKSHIDKVCSSIEHKAKLNEARDIISEWKLKDIFLKARIKVFRYGRERFIEELKIKNKSITINSKHMESYKQYPIKVYGIKKSRNKDVMTNSRITYNLIKKYIDDNNKDWSITLDKVTGYNGKEVGFSSRLRENNLQEIKGILQNLFDRIKKEVKK